MDSTLLRVPDTPDELMRGIHMVSAVRRITLRSFLISAIYEAVDRELADWPEWRYQTKRGEEHLLYADGRKAAGLKRRKKKPVVTEDSAI